MEPRLTVLFLSVADRKNPKRTEGHRRMIEEIDEETRVETRMYQIYFECGFPLFVMVGESNTVICAPFNM